jgi:hypothetical protein
MKKLKKRISTFLPTAKIFLDDVEKIEEIVRESCSSYNITFNDPNLDSMSEIQRTRKPVEEYSFYTIILEKEYELNSINEINELKEITEKENFHNLEITLTKPYFNLDLDHFETHIYCDDDTLCMGIIQRIKPILLKRKTHFRHGLYGLDKKFIVFTTERYNEKTNFFIKYKDQIILILISGATGALLNTVFTWFRLRLPGQ